MSRRQVYKNPTVRNLGQSPRGTPAGVGTGLWHLIVIVEVESAPGRSVLRGIGRYLREDRECRASHIRPDTKDPAWGAEVKRVLPGAVIARIGEQALVDALRDTGLPVVDIGGELPPLGSPIDR